MPGKGNEAGGKGCRMRAFRKGLLRRFAWLRWNPSFSTDVRNDTAKAYSSAFNLAAAVFVVLVQCCNTLLGGASSDSVVCGAPRAVGETRVILLEVMRG